MLTPSRPVARLAVVLVTSAITLLSSLAAASAATPAPPPSAPPAASGPVPVRSPTPCAVTAKACMDLSGRQAWLTDGAGHVTYGPVPARGGKKSAATPTGTFHVLYRDRDHHSREFDAPMPFSVFFYPGDAFHADDPDVASNGCIHLNRSAASRFYGGLRPGDEVQVVS